MSALEATLADYLSLRRALGHKLAEHERQLTRFVAGLDDAGASFVTMYLDSGVSHSHAADASTRMMRSVIFEDSLCCLDIP